jgi:hypothetical protein
VQIPDSWSAFWPSFAATTLALVPGIPIGLAVARGGTLLGERSQRTRDAQRRSDALRLLHQRVTQNVGVLSSIESVARTEGSILFEPLINSAEWEMERDDIKRLVHEPGFRLLIAHHFDRIAKLERLVRELNAWTVGPNTALGVAGRPVGELARTVRAHVGRRILETCSDARVAGIGALQWMHKDEDGTFDLRRPGPDAEPRMPVVQVALDSLPPEVRRALGSLSADVQPAPADDA